MTQSEVRHTTLCALDGVPTCITNEFFASLLVDTHCALLDDLCPNLSRFIGLYYNKHGIKATITECKSLATNIISHINIGEYPEADWDDAAALCFGGQGHMVLALLTEDHGFSFANPATLATALQCLRFPQRFAYPKDNLDSIPKVLNMNSEHNQTCNQQVTYSDVLEATGRWIGVPDVIRDADLRRYYANVVPAHMCRAAYDELFVEPYRHSPAAHSIYHRAARYYSQFMDLIPELWRPDYDMDFTRGSSYEGDRTLGEKVQRFSETYYRLVHDELYPLIGKRVGIDQVLVERDATRARLINVPKDSAKARVVAPEHVVVNVIATGWRKAIERGIDSFFPTGMIPYGDQNVQERQILDGTMLRTVVPEGFCSIDLSGASDSIPWWQIEYALGYYCVSDTMLQVFSQLRANYLTYDRNSKEVRSHICLTSGNPLTWINESIWFLCICISAMTEQDVWEGIPEELLLIDAARKYAGQISMYGDDTEVSYKYYDAVISGYTLLGYTVNDSKSYNGYFGESCGCDSYRGQDVSSVYWPRKHLTYDFSAKASWKVGDNALTVSSLIALQHRLFTKSPKAAKVLEDQVLRLAPSMTYHAPRTDCSDLWGYCPAKLCPAPIEWKKQKDPVNLALARPDSSINTITLDQARTRAKHYIITTRSQGDSCDFFGNANLEMYLYVHWLRTREERYSPYITESDGGMPCWTWIDGVRCDACIESFVDSTLLGHQPEVIYETHAE